MSADLIRERLARLPGRRCTITALVMWARLHLPGVAVRELVEQLAREGALELTGQGPNALVMLPVGLLTTPAPPPTTPAPPPAMPPQAVPVVVSAPRKRRHNPQVAPRRAVERALERSAIGGPDEGDPGVSGGRW